MKYSIESSASAVSAWSETRLAFEPCGWQISQLHLTMLLFHNKVLNSRADLVGLMLALLPGDRPRRAVARPGDDPAAKR